MPYGYRGNVLRVDLSRGKILLDKPEEDIYRNYIGGRALALYYLLNELPPKTDAFDEKNILIFSNGVLAGAPLSGASRFSVVSKSPLTNTYGEAEAGGYFAPELKFAGYDAVIIKGKAKSPVFLWIKDERVEIVDAEKLWGLTTGEAQSGIRKMFRDERIRVASIGPAGERLVRYACIINENRYANGRGGMGAVMGSKNLKAVAVRGMKKFKMKKPEAVKALARWFGRAYRENPDASGLHKLGTPKYLMSLNLSGGLPTRNFRAGYMEDAESMSGETLGEKYHAGQTGCYACVIRCKMNAKVKGKFENDTQYGAPEYESIGAFGSCCGVSNLEAIIKANEICNRNGVDVISCGVSIAFAMECFENGILNKNETDGIDLRFGNANAIVEVAEKIAKREGIGNLLAEGVARAAEKIGRGAEKYAMHVKGKEIPMHEARFKRGVALGYGVSPTGADHLQMEHDTLFEKEYYVNRAKPLGVSRTIKSSDLGREKVELFVKLQKWYSLANSLELCFFTLGSGRVWEIPKVVEIVSAVTGWKTSLEELLKVGERGITMARCFNLREGVTKKDDVLPDRLFEPLENGALKGAAIDREEYEKAVQAYYEIMGWDEEGRPTKEKMKELGIGWALRAF
jgi:aldehyde:ferredoxin oxidoreductase